MKRSQRMNFSVFCLGVVLTGSQAWALGGTGIGFQGSLAGVGTQNTSPNLCFIRPGANNLGCTDGGAIYFDCSTPSGQATFASASAALNTGKQFYINFNQDSNGNCSSMNYTMALP